MDVGTSLTIVPRVWQLRSMKQETSVFVWRVRRVLLLERGRDFLKMCSNMACEERQRTRGFQDFAFCWTVLVSGARCPMQSQLKRTISMCDRQKLG